ncbi:hypothetical protein RhiJN_19847 [Ceratobasidium sp. AG-Ba]|nr:hypothetical protein RhiJN_05017 [Ceratobasidium sp. AG-Ba]QRV91829.1 hypothetical protein RhiJN_19847 [Ceratobasidium sp. AG-Ba]
MQTADIPLNPSSAQSASPIAFQSGWLLSEEVLAMRFMTSFALNLDPALPITSQMLELKLGELSRAQNAPDFYLTLNDVLMKIAEALDSHQFHQQPGLQHIFFPKLVSTEPNKRHHESHHRMVLDLRLLDHVLGIHYSSLRVPQSLLHRDDLPPAELSSFPRGASPYERADWMFLQFHHKEYEAEHMMESLNRQLELGEASASDSTQISVGTKLSNIIASHQKKIRALSYEEVAARLAKALWLYVEPEKKAADNHRTAIRTLQLVSTTSILAPFLQILLDVPSKFSVNEVKLNEALLNINRPNFNRSTPTLLQIEEILWPSVFDLIQQCRNSTTATVTPNWQIQHLQSQEWAPSKELSSWTWVRRHMIESTSATSAAMPGNEDGYNTNLTNSDNIAGDTAPVPEPTGNELAHRSGTDVEGLGDKAKVSETTNKDPLGADAEALKDHGSSGAALDQGSKKHHDGGPSLRKRPPPSEKDKSLPSQGKYFMTSYLNMLTGKMKDKQDLPESVPLFHQFIPTKLSREEKIMSRVRNWKFNKIVKPVGDMYSSPKEKLEFKAEVRIHRLGGNTNMEYAHHTFHIPKIPDQQHDFKFFKLVSDLAAAQQDTLPSFISPALHMTYQESCNLKAEKLEKLFEHHCLVIEAPPSSQSTPSLFADEKGHITLDAIIDPQRKVEVHDLSASSLQYGKHQATSRFCTLAVAMEHLNAENGRTLNLLDLGNNTSLFPQPPAVMKLDSDLYAFNSSEGMAGCDPYLPKRGWLIVGGGGAISHPHADAAGKATYVHCHTGVGKIWLLCLGPKEQHKSMFDNAQPWRNEPLAYVQADDVSWINNYYWQTVYLPPGATLIMQPYVWHMVLTPGPTLCDGGHFYSAATMNRTLHAKRLEHVHPRSLSNETQNATWVTLHRMMIFAGWKILDCHATSPYSIDSLAMLIVMCLRPAAFTHPTEPYPTNTMKYEIQEQKARQAAEDVRKYYTEVETTVSILETRLDEWEGRLYEHWDTHQSRYELEVFESDDDEDMEGKGEAEAEAAKLKGSDTDMSRTEEDSDEESEEEEGDSDGSEYDNDM